MKSLRRPERPSRGPMRWSLSKGPEVGDDVVADDGDGFASG